MRKTIVYFLVIGLLLSVVNFGAIVNAVLPPDDGSDSSILNDEDDSIYTDLPDETSVYNDLADETSSTSLDTTDSTVVNESTDVNNDYTEGLDSTDGKDLGDPIIYDDPADSDGPDSTDGQDMGDPIIYDNPNDGPNPDLGEANDDLQIITMNTFIANAGKPYYGTTGVSVQFDASASIGAVTYNWDFGDETTGTGKTPTHTYTKSGEYYVTLAVTNNTGSILIDVTPVYISQTGNYLKPYGKTYYKAEKYETITFDASQSTSTDPNAPIVSYKWYFGDGDTATGQIVTHSYSISKAYLVILEVTDSRGNTKQDVIHADIGKDLTKMDDFFILSDLAELFTAFDLYSYFDVSIYTNYNGVEKNTPVRSGGLPVSIDVNDDGSSDISVGSIKLFKPSISKSQFNDFPIPWFVFTTTLSSVSILSGGSITQSDDFTVCLQMSLDKIPNIGLDEKRVRVGYYSAAGEEKPSGAFGIKHLFRPYLLLRSLQQTWDLYPEVGSSITASGGADKFSLFTNFADVNDPTIQSTMTLHYDPFIESTLIHRRGKTSDGLRLYDIAFKGSGSSAVSLYFTRQNAEGSASFGVLIDPIQNFVFHVDATPLATGGGSITFRSEEIIDNIVLFAKSEEQTGKDIYFYLKHLPNSIDVTWDPSLKDGFIRASNVQGNERLEVGICNDLNTPTWKINATNLPDSVDLSWDLSVEGQIQLKTTNTGNIALDYYGWREDRVINFHVDSQDDINVAASWNLTQGWFKVIRSDNLINFRFSILQKGMPKGDLLVDLSGKLAITHEDEGLEVLFGDFEQGVITINNAITGIEVSVGVTVKYGDLQVGVESLGLGASGGGSAVIRWDDTPKFKVEANLVGPTGLEMSNFNLIFGNLNMAIGTLDLYGPGYAEIKWNEASKTVGIGASAKMTSTDIVLDSEGIHLSAGSLNLGGSASASIVISEGFSVSAGASIQLGDFNVGVGNLDLKIGTLYLSGSGSVSVKKGNLDSLQLQGSTTFGIGRVDFSYNGLSIKIQGSLDISAGGTVILDKSHLELQGTLTVTIPTQCTFVINAETIKVQGTFKPTSKGKIHVSWGSSNSITLGADISTTIDNFYFEYQTLKASSGNINLRGSGDISIGLGSTFTASGTISGGFSLNSFVFTVGNDNPKVELTKIDLGANGAVSVVSGSTLKVSGDVAFYLEDLYFKSSSMEVKIDGVVDLDAGGYVEVGDNKFEMSVSGLVNLGCTFHVNGKIIGVAGAFNLGGAGTIALKWDTALKYVELTGTGGGLTVNGLNFNYDSNAFIVTANKIEFALGGRFYVSWDQNALKVDGGNGAYLKIKDIEVKAGSTNIKIIGSVDIGANGYIYAADGKLELQITGSMNLGSCSFYVNGKTITASGNFNLNANSGKITLTWANNNVDLSIPGANVPLSVTNLNFVYDQFTLSADTISFTAGGKFHAEWDTVQNSIKIEGGSADLTLSNVHLKYGTQIDITIGSLKLNAGGYVRFQDKLFEIKVTGSLDLNTNFIMGGKNIKAIGNFNLNGLTGTVQLKWDNNYVELLIPEGGVTLNVNNLDFGYGTDLTIKADNINFGANGKFHVGWSNTPSSLDINGGSANLAVTNVYITQGSSLDIDIVGSLSLQAGGSVHFENQLLRFIGSASVSLSGTTFKINSDSIYAKGTFSLQGGTGTIDINWGSNLVKIYVNSGSLKLDVTNLEVQYGIFNIKAAAINIGAGGQFNVQWDTTLNTLEITGVSASLSISNVYITYGSTLDIDIDGFLSLEAGGKVFFKNGLLRLSGSANFNLVGTKITINSQSIKAEGSFALSASAGSIEFTWDAENIGVKVTGGASLTVTNPYLETQKIIIDADQATLGVNGNLAVQILKATKVFKVSGDVDFKLTSLIIKYESTQIFSATLFDIKGGGTVNIGSTYSLQLSASVDIDNLNFNPPADWSWPLDYIQGSFALSGSGAVSAGDGTFNMDATLKGTIDSFKLYFTSTHLQFYKLTANTAVQIGLTGQTFSIVGSGQIDLSSFNAQYDQWVANLASVHGDGYINFRISSLKRVSVAGNAKFSLGGFEISRGSLAFRVDSIENDAGGQLEIDLGTTKKVDIHGNGKIYIEFLSFTSTDGLNVNIPIMDLAGNGDLDATWTSSTLNLGASVDINFRLSVNTATYGSWYATADLNGGITLDSSWSTGESGSATLTITRAGQMNGLTITHDDLSLNLGALNLNTGSMALTWSRGDAGYLQIQNTITGSLSLLKLTKGTFDLNIGTLTLSSGTGKISWNKVGQEVQITNGILSVQPLQFTLKLNDVTFTASVTELQKNTQPIIIRWYKDASGINGIFVDTNDQALANLIDFTVTQSDKGARITLYGLRANDFKMEKTGTGWQFSGSVQVANRLTVSLLYSGTWHTIDLQWSFPTGDLETKSITYTCSETITIQLSSLTIKDWTFISTINLNAGYMKLDWHFSSTTNHIRFDTGGKSMGSINFEANKGTSGFKLSASVLKASNGRVTWNGWPPAGITWDGTIDLVSINSIYAKLSGTTWYKIYPLTMTNPPPTNPPSDIM